MKKNYIKPSVSVSFAVFESCLLTGSGVDDGIGRDQSYYGGGASKKNDFSDDFFDESSWPKNKSPWEDWWLGFITFSVNSKNRLRKV